VGTDKSASIPSYDWRLTAAEVMLGELPHGVEPCNFRDTAGPAESQLYLDELNDDRVEG